MRVNGSVLLVSILSCALSPAQGPKSPQHTTESKPPLRSVVPARALKVCTQCLHAYEDFLASDALNGRGSATHDELIAATYVASELEQFGILPAGDDGGYLQKVPLIRRKYSIPAQLRFDDSGSHEEVNWKHGLEFLLLHSGSSEVNGPLQKMFIEDGVSTLKKGAFVFLQAKPGSPVPARSDALRFWRAGAAAVMIPQNPGYGAYWQQMGEKLFAGKIELPDDTGMNPMDRSTLLMLNDEAAKRLEQVADGIPLSLKAPLEKTERLATWNVLGKIPGRSATLAKQNVLFSAHYDHLGVGHPVNGDSIYNGADDDASGVTAVLELARVLGSGVRPRRSVLFALFGSEELGELGSEFFRDHSSVPIDQIIANLEFEMIGRPDPKIPSNALFVTGWDRSNLGPALEKHGARLVADPHPEQNFFERSDNFQLAKRGVVAQTISSYGLHEDYHQPSDDIAHLDFKHMEDAIQSLLGPADWLVNSSFTPQWKEGSRP